MSKEIIFNCSWCGKDVQTTSYGPPYGPRMENEELCFTCVHWDIEANRTDSRRIVIKGYCYGVGKEPRKDDKGRILENSSFLGMAGRRFDIEIISTGQRFTTHNLWGGGTIPDRFRDKLPDTARFLNGAEKAIVGETTCWDSSSNKNEPYPSFDQIMAP